MSYLDFSALRSLDKYPIVLTVAGISCIAYLLLVTNGLSALDGWFMPDALSGLLNLDSIWRLWSPTFIHYTFLHLLTNLYLWWLFASKIEEHSKIELLIVCVIAAACANFFQWWAMGPNFGGLSGLAYALLGYLWVSSRYGGQAHYRIDPQLALVLLILIPIAATGVLGKFANVAHVTGLVSGALIAIVKIYQYKQVDS